MNPRLITRLSLAFAAVLVVLSIAPAAFAQEQGVVASFAGTLSNAAQEDRVAFEVDPSQYTLNGKGQVDLVFVLNGVNGAGTALDPGLISVESKGAGSVKVDTRKPDTTNSTASIALATVTPGQYEIVVRSEHKTFGAYRLDVLLAGDANGDFKVDTADLDVIAQLSGKKSDDADYSSLADVDRQRHPAQRPQHDRPQGLRHGRTAALPQHHAVGRLLEPAREPDQS